MKIYISCKKLVRMSYQGSLSRIFPASLRGFPAILCDIELFPKKDEREFRVMIKHYFVIEESPQGTKEKPDKDSGEFAI